MLKTKNFLIIGDVLAIAIVTIIGFVTHGEGNLSFLPRFLAAFVPIIIAWLLLSPWFGLFQLDVVSNAKQLWRGPLVMIFAGPMAVVLRGLILNAAIIPIFAVVFSLTSAFGIVVWRAVYYFLLNRQDR